MTACNNAEMNLKSTGAFLSTQNSGLVYQMEQTISVCSNQNIRDQLWRLSTLTGQVISVDQTDGPFPFDKIVVPRTALLYPAYKNNNQTRGGLDRVCATGMYRSIGHVELPKLQTGISVERKAPCNYQLTAQIPNNRCGYTGHFYCPKWPFYSGKLAG